MCQALCFALLGRLRLSLRSLRRLVFVTQVRVCVNHFLHFRLAYRLVQCRWHFAGMPTPALIGRVPLCMFVSYSPRVVNMFVSPKRKNPPKFSEGLHFVIFGYHCPISHPPIDYAHRDCPVCLSNCLLWVAITCLYSCVFLYMYLCLYMYLYYLCFFSNIFPSICHKSLVFFTYSSRFICPLL